MRILFILSGVWYDPLGEPVVSGGDVVIVEIARRWAKYGFIHVLTSAAGKDLCYRMGLRAEYHEFAHYEKLGIPGRLAETLSVSALSRRLELRENTRFDLVCSSCEHLNDVLPALQLKKSTPAAVWVAIVHFVVPSPSHRWKAGMLRSILYFLNHRLGATMIRMGADLIVAVSEKTASEYVTRLGFSQNRVMPIPGGLDFDLIQKTASAVSTKEYDAIFMKRLHPMKGALEVLEIWRNVVNLMPAAKLLIAGGGTREMVNKVNDTVTRLGLGQNIVIRGSIYDQREKIRALAKSRVFLLPSFEENWALVIGEALAAGLPVVAYSLPEIRQVWGEHVVWIPKGDKIGFSKATSEILLKAGKTGLPQNLDFLREYDWNSIADLVWRRCERLISSV